MVLNQESSTLAPLPDVLSKGLVAVSTFGLVSFSCSTSLFFYLTWRLITWRSKTGPNPPINQFFILIYNLLLADIQQACAFMLNISALRNNAIAVGSTTCWAQGWFVSTGDLASSVFICGIAVHTFFSVVKEYRLPSHIFYTCIACGWSFVYLMGIIGPVLHGEEFFVRASAWCWINEEFEIERLWLHYFWIFAFMLVTILLYVLVFFYLRQKSKVLAQAAHSSFSYSSRDQVDGATPLMILYPLIYTVCTTPLAAGRISALAGNSPSLAYFCVAGTMIACNGWLDVLLYALTRADIVFSDTPPSQETGLETFAFMGHAGRMEGLGTVTTIEGGNNSRRDLGARMGMSRGTSFKDLAMSLGGKSRMGSRENLYGLDRINNIEVKGEVTVSVHQLEHELERPNQSRRGSGKSWDQSSGKSTPSLNGD